MISDQRQVSFRTVLDLVKRRPILLIIGTIFTVLPFFFGGIFALILSTIDSDVPEINYSLLNSNGSRIQATITNVEEQENISINDAHPVIISYSFEFEGEQLEDRYKILDPKASQMKVGNPINIRFLNGHSIIAGIKPFAFPISILLVVLTPFLVIGLVLLGYLYWSVSNQIGLFKNGKVVEAEIISMALIPGLAQKIVVHYQYKLSGQAILAKSTTTDYTILTRKKQGESVKIFVSPNDETKSCLVCRLDDIRNDWKIL
jgi:hypothetical protein